MLHKKKKGLEFSWTNTPDHTQMQSGWWDTVWVNYSFMTHPRNHSIFIHKLCFPWTNDIRRKWCYQHYCFIQRIGDASQIWERWGDQQMFLRFTSWGKFNVMVTDLENTHLTVLHGSCLFPWGFPWDSNAGSRHLISTCKYPPFYAWERSFYNPEQLDSNCPGEVRKAVGRKASLQALALLSSQIVISLEGRPISLLSASQSPFLFTFDFMSKIEDMILSVALLWTIFNVYNLKWMTILTVSLTVSLLIKAQPS